MPKASKNSVFAQTITAYLAAINALDRDVLGRRPGLSCDGEAVTVPLLGDLHRVTANAITDRRGRQPSHAVSVVICRYLLHRSGPVVEGGELLSYKDFQGSAPYASAFTATVEEPLAAAFAGRLPRLRRAAGDMGGCEVTVDFGCDYAGWFQALPELFLTLLFYDQDEEFPARCTLLFQRRAVALLDMESLALVGDQLRRRLLD